MYAVAGASIEVREGEFVVLLGPSGCGKTTLLRCVAGLDTPQTGEIRVAGKLVFSGGAGRESRYVPAAKRGLSMMFQSYALWPHMTVAQNISYPLEVRGVSSAARAKRVSTMLELLGLEAVGGRYPSRLSGGQQQRVALGRALISESPLILFDEPLSNVDAKVRDQLRGELARMQHELGFAGLYVTHDQREAFGLGKRVAVMRAGRVEQIGAPKEIYQEPRSLYVARFVGTTNELPGTVTALRDGLVEMTTEIGTITGRVGETVPALGDVVVAVFRPEVCKLVDDDDLGPTGTNTWTGRVESTMFEGAVAVHTVRVGDHRLLVSAAALHAADLRGREVRVRADTRSVLVLPDDTDPRADS
ncbi:ABC transporter ATP-binding protein [Compostimonas suwonensis]|uniref:ABC transporter ATP-binding protein n=1 Tax=Compostimonas suwonensis TaxID=1048394 RepID=UPI0014750FC8|nr:ABC transporter ATP-binding protein [Compostimonas suwonensis]